MKRLRLSGALERVNKELWVVLSLFAIALLLNQVIAAQRMVLSFYVLPTIASAYFYGRRHGTLTAFASVLLVVGLLLFRNSVDGATAAATMTFTEWLEVVVWGGSLIVTGYLMGTLYEHKNQQINELRETYQGVLMILRHFISKDTYTENHCYRVSVYATRIAAQLNLPDRPHRGREGGRAAARYREARDQPRPAVQSRAPDTRRTPANSGARPARHRDARTCRRRAEASHSDHPGAPRQVRRNRLQPDQRRSDSVRSRASLPSRTSTTH